MAMKQPRVPQYQKGEGVEAYIGSLILFLKDFCQEVWTESRLTRKRMDGIRFPVTSVNGKTGEVSLGAQDVGARAEDWMPTAAQVGALASDGTAVNATKFNSMTWAQMLTTVYPIGAVYISTASTSPASLFGGTWEQLKDRFLLGAGSKYAAGSTGGAATVTLTIDQMPEHRHILRKQSSSPTTEFSAYAATSDDSTDESSSASDGVRRYTTYTGGGEAHNNMPPYVTVYMWKRVS